MIHNIAVKTTGSVISKGSNEVLTEGNYEFFRSATPANLKLVEGLWYTDQENKELLTMLIKGYGAYAFAVNETEALEDLLLENEDSFAKEQAILNYEKAIFYSMKYLNLKGIDEDEFSDKGFSLILDNRFSDVMNESDHIAMFYFAQSLGGVINLQRDKIAKMAKLNHVRSLIKWVCRVSPNIENGSCMMFKAVIEASTPTLLGGKPAKAQALFKKAITTQPQNLLHRINYIHFSLLPMLEEEEYYQEMEKLNKELISWYNTLLGNQTKKNEKFVQHRYFNLYNSVAKKRFEIFRKTEKELF